MPDDKGIRFEPTVVRFGQREIPGGPAGRLLRDTPRELDLSPLPLGLEPRRPAVTDHGLRPDLTGGPASVKT